MAHTSKRQAGAKPEIEITSKMVLAAQQVLWDSGKWRSEAPADELFVREILQAAIKAREVSKLGPLS